MSDTSIHLFDDYFLDLARGCLTRARMPVHLRRQSYEVLEYLVENRGRLISKDQLIKQVWQGRAVTDSSLGKCIEEVRQALGEKARNYVRTERGRGYIFDTGVDELYRLPASEPEQSDGLGIAVEPHEGLPLVNVPKALPRTAESDSASRLRRIAIAGMLVLAIGGVAGYRFFSNRASNSAPITSIAVLPFANETGNADVEYLTDGMSESLINRLSQVPQLKVIARNSAFQYKGKDVSSQDVSRALGVQAILLGRVAQRGDDLLLSIELMDVRDRTQVWGERYIRKAIDIQALQEEMASMISDKLRLRLSGAQGRQLTRYSTQNSQAYQFYLNGLFHYRKGLPDDVRKALDYYNRAVALDRDFALAWVGVARANRYFSGNSLLDPREPLARAKAATQKALELDEALAEAHVELAWIKQDEWDWAGAEREYQRALELNPNLVDAHLRYAGYLSVMERHAEALHEIKRAQELDPLEIALTNREAWTLTLARRCDEAIEKYQLLKPGLGKHFSLGFAYEQKGMYHQAIEEFRKGINIQGETTSNSIYLGFNLAMAGRTSEALSILNRLMRTKEYVSREELAGLYVALGDKESALTSLENAYAEHDLQLQNLKIDWRLDSLRSDPRFQDLLRRVGLPESRH